MKYLVSVISLFSFFLSLAAQDFEEIKKLESEQKFEAVGIMYHDMYMFPEAVDAFEKRIEFLNKQRNPNPESLALADSLLRRSERTARMISRCEDVQIVDSVIIDKETFLDALFMGDGSGKLFTESGTVVYENQLEDRRFYGKKDSTGYFKLYSRTKIAGSWTDEILLDIPSEGEGSDNFPFVMPDGLTMYYASTREGSIGGYDLYATRYNLNSETYFAPNQMGMPFNSLYNDYFLAIDEENEIGYFVSDRFQPEDKVIVYAFIPNEEYISLPEELSGQERINRATIHSLKDSWKPGVDYSNYLAAIKENIEKRKQIKQRDFTFVINDNILYYTLVDFESDAAKKLFLKWQAIDNDYHKANVELEAKRKEYAHAAPAARNALKGAILSAEQKQEELFLLLQQTAKEARNTEIKYLRQKQ